MPPTQSPSRRLEDLVVITGFSGAGKSTAMNVFEDAGYFCVDNLPPGMIRALVELFMHKGSKVERAAVVSDVRGGDYFEALAPCSTTSTRSGIDHHVLFLDASEQTLHEPLQGDAPAPSARARAAASPPGSPPSGRCSSRCASRAGPRDRHDRAVGRDAARQDRRRVPAAPARGRLAVTFMSFGFKHGPPRDADLVFDVRFLPNPHYEPELRALTGPRRAVVEYIAPRRAARGVLRALEPLLDFLLPQYVAEGKAHLVDRDRLHGRAPPLGRDRRAPRGALPRRRRPQVAVAHRDIDKSPRRPRQGAQRAERGAPLAQGSRRGRRLARPDGPGRRIARPGPATDDGLPRARRDNAALLRRPASLIFAPEAARALDRADGRSAH